MYGEEPSASADRTGNRAAVRRDVARDLARMVVAGRVRQRDMTVTVRTSGSRTGGRLATYDMSVVDQQSGRWYVKDIRASTQPMGTQ